MPERDARSGSTEWFTGDEFTENMWSLDPCGDQIRATDPQPFSVSTVHRAIDVPEDLRQHQRRQLAVYPSPYTAALVMDEFRRLLAECSHTESDSWEDMEWWWVTEDRPDLGDEGIVAASVSRGPSVYPSGERVAVTRVGSLVFLARISAAYDSAELDDGALAVQQVAQWFVDSL